MIVKAIWVTFLIIPISYYDHSNGDLMVAKCNDVACTSTPTITRVDSAGDVGSYSSIATTSLAIARRPVISYYDATGGDLKLVLCGNEACSSGNSILRIISFGNHGKLHFHRHRGIRQSDHQLLRRYQR